LQGFVALSGYADSDIDNCDFWDERISWHVPITSEVMAFDDNNKKTMFDFKDGYDVAEEILWIKEAR
jgi:hypothetical protein